MISYSSPNIEVVKSRRMGWARHVARMGWKRKSWSEEGKEACMKTEA